MLNMVGKFLSFINLISPLFAFKLRCKVANNIISRHAFSMMERLSVIRYMNIFLMTMNELDRHIVMENIGVKKYEAN